jgi:RimJ/RimL family protein N-acetyltransferase
MNFNLILENNAIKLRPVEPEDYERFLPLTTGKKMWYYFTDDLSERKSLKSWVETAIAQTKAKTRLAFTIIDKTQDKIIGSTSFGNISERDKRIEIGWTWICSEYQGSGANDQAKYLLLQYCFDELGFERVEFKTDVLNTFARKALERIGAVEEGILRNHTLMTNNRRRDTIYYSILNQEWVNRKDFL